MTVEPEDAAQGSDPRFAVFLGVARIASGGLADAAIAAGRARENNPDVAILIFDRRTGGVVDLDLRGGGPEIAKRLTSERLVPAKRGRPKLGVVAREVTLLPRHWDWLSRQPGGASAALRRLVEAAGKAPEGDIRERAEAAYRFMAAMAGDLPGFEEAARALFAGDRGGLKDRAARWPPDIREEVLSLLDESGARPEGSAATRERRGNCPRDINSQSGYGTDGP